MNEPKQFRKQPVVIEAMQFVGDTADTHAVYSWIEQNTQGSYNTNDDSGEVPESGVSIDAGTGFMVIATLEGEMQVKLGDWVIRGVQGEFYPCKPDIFWQSYEPVETESDVTESPVNAEPKEWIERQEEERRAWAINSAIEYARHTGNPVSLTGLAGQIVDFVKGPEPVDPDLHDQDAIDQFYASYAELAGPGAEHIRQLGDSITPTEEDIEQAATELLDKMSKAGVRLKVGKTIDEVLAED